MISIDMDIVKLCLPSECLPDCIQPTCGALHKVSAVLLIRPHGKRDRAVRGELQHSARQAAIGCRVETAYKREPHTSPRSQQLAQQLCDSVWRRLPGIQAAIKCMTLLMRMREGRHAPFGARSSCREGCAGVVGADCATSCLPAPPWVSRALLPGIACMQNFDQKSRPCLHALRSSELAVNIAALETAQQALRHGARAVKAPSLAYLTVAWCLTDEAACCGCAEACCDLDTASSRRCCADSRR